MNYKTRNEKRYKAVLGRSKWRGFTLAELMACLALAGLALLLGVPAFTAALERWDAEQGVRTVTTALASARFTAIETNSSIKCTVEDNRCMVLNRKSRDLWMPFMRLQAREGVTISINANPVFAPTGMAAPLCSVFVQTERHHYVVTISMAGRIEVEKQ